MTGISKWSFKPRRLRPEPRDPTAPAILEFQWPSTSVINTPVPRIARGTVWLVASLVFVLIALMGLIKVDQVVAARGLVVSSSPNILVQPLETAIVRSIDVREGQRVVAGQVLAHLDPTFASADLAVLEAKTSSLEAEVARLQAEADNESFLYNGASADWLLQGELFERRRALYVAKLQSFDRQLDEISSMSARSASDFEGYRARLDVAESIEDMRRQLEASKTGSKLSRLLAEDNRAEMARATRNAAQSAEAAERQKAAVAAERNAFVQGWRAEVSQDLTDATRRLADSQELLSKAKLRKQFVELRSESDAIVQSVAEVSVGSILQSGERIFTLVPINAPVEIEANIVGRSSGYVQPGDPVSIKFDTFPFAQYGLALGEVLTISPDSFSARDEARDPHASLTMLPANTEPFYRARISLDQVNLRGVPADSVTPGMPVTADIKVGKRTVLTYLLSRVLPVTQEGMREP